MIYWGYPANTLHAPWAKIARNGNPEAIQRIDHDRQLSRALKHNSTLFGIAFVPATVPANNTPQILIDNPDTRPTCTISADLPREEIRGYPEPDCPPR